MERFAWWGLALASALILILLVAGCPAHARGAETCVTNYRSLPANHGWRRYRVVNGRHCWYVAGHDRRPRAQVIRHASHYAAPPRRSARPPAPPVVVDPPPVAPPSAVSAAMALLVIDDDDTASRIDRAFFAISERDLLPVAISMPRDPPGVDSTQPPAASPPNEPPPRRRVVSLAAVAIVALFGMAIVAWPIWSSACRRSRPRGWRRQVRRPFRLTRGGDELLRWNPPSAIPLRC